MTTAHTPFRTPAALALGTPDPLPSVEPMRLLIVVPVVRPDPTPRETMALATLAINAADTPKVVLAPQSLVLGAAFQGWPVVRVPDEAMRSRDSYNAMLMTAWFWDMFSVVDQILIFQLDCLLLRPDLEEWGGTPQSFWGAPNFRRLGGWRGGLNGGFSLRRPRDHLAVLRESSGLDLRGLTSPIVRQLLKGAYAGNALRGLLAALASSGRQGFGERFVQLYDRAEDEFWSIFAPLLSRHFTLPSPAATARFAAEHQGQVVIAANGGELPLGVHAWQLDEAFWLERVCAIPALAHLAACCRA